MKVMYDVNTNSPSTPQQTLSQENKSQHLSNDRIDTIKSTNTGIYSFHVVNPLPNTFLKTFIRHYTNQIRRQTNNDSRHAERQNTN